jgi:hypothetical protein
MRKMRIVPAIALSMMTLGIVAYAVPASASPTHASVRSAGEDNDGTDVTTPGSGGGGGGTPSGGAATGAGGMATTESRDVAPFVASGVAGLGLLGASVLVRRRRSVEV